MKKIIFLVLILVFYSSTISYGKDYYKEQDMYQTFINYYDKSESYSDYTIDDFSEDVWKKHGLLVTKENALKQSYSTNHVINRGEKFWVDNKNRTLFRYLGTNTESYVVENPDYPADTANILQFEDFTWTKNLNRETSLLSNIRKLSTKDQQEYLNFYWDLIDSSFTREYSKYYHSHKITPKIKQDILDAAILVYPIAEVPRHLLSFRNGSIGQYEVTASTERGDNFTPEVITTEETIPSLPIATQSKGNTLLIGSNQPGAEIFSNAYVYAVKREEVQSKKLDKGKVILEPKQGYGVAAYPNQTN